MKTIITASLILLFQFVTYSAEWRYHFKGDYITGISQHASSIWIGTYAAGIVELDPSGIVLNHFTKENSPLLTNSIDWIEVDHNGVVWFAMDYVGIGKFDGTNWTFFTKSDFEGSCKIGRPDASLSVFILLMHIAPRRAFKRINPSRFASARVRPGAPVSRMCRAM